MVAAFALLTGTAIVVAPAHVARADETVASVSAGLDHTCAVTAGGAAQCWGWNAYGQLGDGSTVDRSTPGDVSGLGSGVAAVSTGAYSSCALMVGGSVKCWGDNGDGVRDANDSSVPIDVVGLGSGVTAVTVGGQTACALTGAGGVRCWGAGYGSASVAVPGLGSGISAVTSGGSSMCALTTGGAAKCWGDNHYGQLGDGTTVTRATPVTVSGLGTGVGAVSAGGSHVCGVLNTGAVTCWGRNNQGQLGDGTVTDSLTPVGVGGLDAEVTSVSGSMNDTCALTSAGGVECWGRNEHGELGNATMDESHVPVGVAGLDAGVVSVSAGGGHACALTSGGAILCWGFNESGELGDGASWTEPLAKDVVDLGSGVASVGLGYHHTCAVTTGEALRCWGANANGQLGDGTTIEDDVPVDVATLGGGVAAVTAGYQHTCALTTGGAVKCWGDNNHGQLGDGTTTDRDDPVTVSALGSGISRIAAGSDFTCALTHGGAVKCWGAPFLGDGTTQGHDTPVPVSGLGSGVVAIAAGGDACAITSARALKCWGEDGTGHNHLVPVGVAGLSSGVEAVEAAASSTCVLMTGGGIKCWGDNTFGVLGDGTTTDRSSPVDVATLGAGVTSIATEGDHGCAITIGGALHCWGGNSNGQLGIGPAGESSVPVGVVGLGLGLAVPSDPPASVSVSPADGAAAASWAPPADDGGADVYGYALTVLNARGGAATGVDGSRTRTTSTGVQLSASGPAVRAASAFGMNFSGLSNGAAYRLAVAPLTKAGMGRLTLSSVVRPGSVSTPSPTTGYWMVDTTGHVYAFGGVSRYGNAKTVGVVHIESTPSGRGYWIVNAYGDVFAFGDAPYLSGAGVLAPGELVSSLSSTPTGNGYWLFTTRGRVFGRGDAHSFGDLAHTALNAPVVGSVASPTGNGYYMVGADGGVFAFGDAKFRGSMGGARLNGLVTGIVPASDNRGYWLVASDGGVFAFDAPFRGSMGGRHLNRPVVAIARYGNGYLLTASDGGVFDFSNRPFRGSLGGQPPSEPIVAVAAGD